MLWFREIFGWLLIVAALIVLQRAFVMLTNLEAPRVIEGGILVLAGLGIMKAGLTLIRIATAGRIVS